MTIISGVLKDGAGQPVAGCTIQLKAMNTTNAVIRTTTARVGTKAGEYRIEALPASYEVTLATEGSPPQKVGAIDVYADSNDGSLNDFLMAVRGDYLRPDLIRQFELLAQEAKESASAAGSASQGMGIIKDAAEKAASNAALSEKHAADSALTASKSEASAADSAVKAAASEKATALHEQSSATHETNAGQSAKDAELNATKAADSALNAGKSATEAADHAANAQTQATSADTSAQDARKAAVDAQQAATTAASDAVASAVPEAVKQVTTAVGMDADRAKAAADSAETSNTGAQKALEAAQLIAKTPGKEGPPGPPGPPGGDGSPGQSAYDVWRSQMPVGPETDTSMDAFMAYMKGAGEGGISPPGAVGSIIFGMCSDNAELSAGKDVEGSAIANPYLCWSGSFNGQRLMMTGPYDHYTGVWTVMQPLPAYGIGLFIRKR